MCVVMCVCELFKHETSDKYGLSQRERVRECARVREDKSKREIERESWGEGEWACRFDLHGESRRECARVSESESKSEIRE